MSWQEKREILLHRLERGPNVAQTNADLYSRQGFHKVVRQLVAAALVESPGSVRLPGSTTLSHVFAAVNGPRWKRNQLLHDVLLFRVLLALGLDYLLGGDVDGELLPDGEVYDAEDRRLLVEMCTGSCTYREIKDDRFPVYEGCADPVVWVSAGLWSTRDTRRMHSLRRLAKNPRIWFCTLSAVLKKGMDTTVRNCDGEKKVLTEVMTAPRTPVAVNGPSTGGGEVKS